MILKRELGDEVFFIPGYALMKGGATGCSINGSIQEHHRTPRAPLPARSLRASLYSHTGRTEHPCRRLHRHASALSRAHRERSIPGRQGLSQVAIPLALLLLVMLARAALLWGSEVTV
jgi:hypothetical protein